MASFANFEMYFLRNQSGDRLHLRGSREIFAVPLLSAPQEFAHFRFRNPNSKMIQRNSHPKAHGKIGLTPLSTPESPRRMPKRELNGTEFPARLRILARPTTNSLGGREEKEPGGIIGWRKMLSRSPFTLNAAQFSYVETRSSWAT